MLFPSPTHETVSPVSEPNVSRRVRRSARTCRGWNLSLNALITGIVECPANCSTVECSYTRARIPSLYPDSTRAVSRTDSFTPNCKTSTEMFSDQLNQRKTRTWMSSEPRNNAHPPSLAMPVSVDTRVRVLRFWKSIASVRFSRGAYRPPPLMRFRAAAMRNKVSISWREKSARVSKSLP
jgi:hypothetical protein